jgi:Cu+-exporting ATPase
MSQRIDPVCGMKVDPESTPHSFSKGDQAFYFCSAGCVEKFRENPDTYISRIEPHAVAEQDVSIKQPERGSDRRTFTCPMHPEVRQTGPGSCPTCGMAPEPLQVRLRR